jgi:hypothetical protein
MPVASPGSSSDVPCPSILLLLADKKLRKLSDLKSDERFLFYNSSLDVGQLIAESVRQPLVVVHKGGYDRVTCEADAEAAARWALLQRLPSSVLLEPLSNAVPFANRVDVCRALAQLSPAVQQPRFAELRGSRADIVAATSMLHYPLLCKPFVACGPAGHDLVLVLREEGLAEVCEGPSALPLPLIAQEFVDHGGVVLKGYTVGELMHVTHKPSLPDLRRAAGSGAMMRDGPATVRLDSQAPLASALDGLLLGASAGGARDPADAGRCDAAAASAVCEARRAEVVKALRLIKAHLGVELLGVDMVAAPDGSLLVVDANHFSGAPGSVPGFGAALAQAAVRHCQARSEPPTAQAAYTDG